MAFHAGLLLALVGVVLSARLRFEGELVLTEGFRLPLTPGAFVRASSPQALRDLAGAGLTVSDVSASYARGTQLTDLSAVITPDDRGVREARRFVSVNVPMEVRGFQLTVESYGYAPALRVVDAAGTVRAEGNVVLRLLPPGTEDAVLLGNGDVLRVRFFPDHVMKGGEDATRSLLPTNPVLRFQWYEGATRVAEGRVSQGEEARVGPYVVAFPDFVYWLHLVVARDPGVPWFGAGALLAAAGLAIRMLFYERSWRARLEPRDGGTAVDLAVSARYYPARLEEHAARFAAAVEGSGDA
jgi:cytochrome c biogenesis protein ResB